jgi:hypothetical protein
MGGAMSYPSTITELDAIFDRSNLELRTHTASATTRPRGPANSYHSIEVKISTANLRHPTANTTYQVRHRKPI